MYVSPKSLKVSRSYPPSHIPKSCFFASFATYSPGSGRLLRPPVPSLKSFQVNKFMKRFTSPSLYEFPLSSSRRGFTPSLCSRPQRSLFLMSFAAFSSPFCFPRRSSVRSSRNFFQSESQYPCRKSDSSKGSRSF